MRLLYVLFVTAFMLCTEGFSHINTPVIPDDTIITLDPITIQIDVVVTVLDVPQFDLTPTSTL